MGRYFVLRIFIYFLFVFCLCRRGNVDIDVLIKYLEERRVIYTGLGKRIAVIKKWIYWQKKQFTIFLLYIKIKNTMESVFIFKTINFYFTKMTKVLFYEKKNTQILFKNQSIWKIVINRDFSYFHLNYQLGQELNSCVSDWLI